MFRPSPLEIGLIVVALLLLFGARRIPDIARSLGQALREFKKGIRDGMDDNQDHPGSGQPRGE
jgi:sec-independent protein translocase protein TatA